MPELNPPVSSDGDEEDNQGCPELPLEGRPPMDAHKDKAAEGHPLGQVVGESPPSEMDRVAEGSALGQVAGGGITDMENTVGKIVSRLTVEEPVADSPTSTIPAEEVRPSGRKGTKAAVGTGVPARKAASTWGAGVSPG